MFYLQITAGFAMSRNFKPRARSGISLSDAKNHGGCLARFDIFKDCANIVSSLSCFHVFSAVETNPDLNNYIHMPFSCD